MNVKYVYNLFSLLSRPTNTQHLYIYINNILYIISTPLAISLFISVINQLHAQKFCFTLSLSHASTCFEHMCLSSGGQNCITPPLVSSHLQVWWYQRLCNAILTPDGEHMCSKHVEARNKLIVKQFCASSWLITEINILRCAASETSKSFSKVVG